MKETPHNYLYYLCIHLLPDEEFDEIIKSSTSFACEALSCLPVDVKDEDMYFAIKMCVLSLPKNKRKRIERVVYEVNEYICD
jgi:hypothetical protein